MKKLDLSRYAPPGLNLKPGRQVFITGAAASALGSLTFFARYFSARSTLYGYDGAVRVLLPDAVMPDFFPLLGNALYGFLILSLCMLGFIVYHYAYHRQGSRSIYLMRRLPNRFELHRRCLTLPLLAALLSLLFALLLILLCYAIYMLATPRECLTPHQWQRIWSVFS